MHLELTAAQELGYILLIAIPVFTLVIVGIAYMDKIIEKLNK